MKFTPFGTGVDRKSNRDGEEPARGFTDPGTTRTFGFVIHPPTVDHVRRVIPATRLLPAFAIEALLERQKPFVVSRIRGVRSCLGPEARGFFVGCPLLPRQMLDLDPESVLERIVAAGKIAERLGAGILGLGGYTSIVGDRGATVANRLKIAVTSGNALTAWSAVEAIRQVTRRRNVDLANCTLAIVGATGSTGSLCTRSLGTVVPRMIITARHFHRLERLRAQVGRASPARVFIEMDVHQAVRVADVVITTTSAPAALFDVNELKPNCIACDVSLPKNIAVQKRARPDVAVIDGGRIRLPFPAVLGTDIGTPPGVVYACMAETMLLTLEGRFENFSLGEDVAIRKLDEIGAIAEKHGFRVLVPADDEAGPAAVDAAEQASFSAESAGNQSMPVPEGR